jgi:ABC-type uncharacterized transport system permease subunit
MARVTVLCFLASYLTALALEWARLRRGGRVNRLAVLGAGVAGFVAHNWYLINRSQQTNLPPLLASTHDWVLVLAWILALAWLVLAPLQRDLALGLFVLPVVIVLVGSSYFLDQAANTALHAERARRGWGMLHAALLAFGVALVASGFISGLMYLIQHRRLKTHHAEQSGLRLPSLARLAQVNWWSIALAFVLLTLGYATGLVLVLAPPGGQTTVSLADLTVVVSAALWMFLAGVFFWLLTHRATGGRQVAWLTLCGCGFLLLALLGLQVVSGSIHAGPQPARRAAQTSVGA